MGTQTTALIGGSFDLERPVYTAPPYRRRTVEQLSDREIEWALCETDPDCKACEIYSVCRYGQEYVKRKGRAVEK